MVPLVSRAIEDALRSFACAPAAGAVALDVGCGEQPLRPLIEALGWQYLSIDVEQNQSRNVDFVAPIDHPLPDELLKRGPFGLVVCTEVLEHVADWALAFENLACLLAPGGRVLITCPHFWPLHEVPHDFWRPTPYALRHFAGVAGLRVIHEQTTGDGFDVIGTALAWTMPLPRNRGVMSRIVALTFDFFRKAAYVALRSAFLRQYVSTDSLLYLSNIAVLENSSRSCASSSTPAPDMRT
jgi:SAM-dependent methyltransferase